MGITLLLATLGTVATVPAHAEPAPPQGSSLVAGGPTDAGRAPGEKPPVDRDKAPLTKDEVKDQLSRAAALQASLSSANVEYARASAALEALSAQSQRAMNDVATAKTLEANARAQEAHHLAVLKSLNAQVQDARDDVQHMAYEAYVNGPGVLADMAALVDLVSRGGEASKSAGTLDYLAQGRSADEVKFRALATQQQAAAAKAVAARVAREAATAKAVAAQAAVTAALLKQRAAISTLELDADKLLARVLQQPRMEGANLVDEVTVDVPNVVPAEGEKRFTVAAVDLGIKDMTPALMARRGIDVHVLPATASLADVTAIGADGVFFSNGPGDPATADAQVGLLRDVLDAGLPFFGICFGHQLFGRALGFGTTKLKYGHRGINVPVMDLATRKVEITAQNHGFAVLAPLEGTTATRWGEAKVSHVCLNDDVVEGLELTDADGRVKAFSVQYHPEAAAGPHDSAYLFDRLVDLLASEEH